MNNWFNEELRTMKKEIIIKYLQAKFENIKLTENIKKVQIENNKNTQIKNLGIKT